MKLLVGMGLILNAWTSLAWGAENVLSLQDVIHEALISHPEISASQALAKSEAKLVSSKGWLDSPRFAWMQEKSLNDMQLRDGAMLSWSISQGLRFPTKYYWEADAQSWRAQAMSIETDSKRLEIRSRAIAGWYRLYAADRILALLNAQREALREVARVAEARRATGLVPQQDEMKAHAEQTRNENEILIAQEERESLASNLNALMNRYIDLPTAVDAAREELAIPKLKLAESDLMRIANQEALEIKSQGAYSEEAYSRKALANWGFAPDFDLSYRRAFRNAPTDAFAITVEATIPLWFFFKQLPEASAASLQAQAAENKKEAVRRRLEADVKSLFIKTKNHSSLLEIYRTSLIPQATSTLNSSQAAYRAGKSVFFELLDSERSLYGVRIAYYRTLSEYVESLTELEQRLGVSVSTLPWGLE